MEGPPPLPSPPDQLTLLLLTGYTGKDMKNENDILMMNNIIEDLGYTGRKDRDSERQTLFTITLP